MKGGCAEDGFFTFVVFVVDWLLWATATASTNA
jgi:hypothetical protein